jgi:hypothetical protein
MIPQSIRVLPQDFSRAGTLQGALDTDWTRIPAYYYDIRQHRLPLTSAEFESDFNASSLKLFSLSANTPGHQTNAAEGSSLNEVFLALGVGVVAIGEGEAFALQGSFLDRPSASQPTPSIAGYCDPDHAACGSGLVAVGYESKNAVLWYGGPTQRFIEKFFQAYRLNVHINRRFLLVDEALSDVGMVPTPPEFVGASDSELSCMPFIQEVNAVMTAKGVGSVFLPRNTGIGLGSENLSSTIQAPPPMAGVTYGHNRVMGLANRIFCFTQPIMFCPGLRFDVSMVPIENDVSFVSQMRAMSTLNTSNPTADPIFTDEIGIPGMEGGFDAVTGLAAPNANSELGSSVITVPGGTVTIGLVLKGFALQPRAALEYLANYACGGVLSGMYAGNSFVSELLAGYPIQQLAGISPQAIEQLKKLAAAKPAK